MKNKVFLISISLTLLACNPSNKEVSQHDKSMMNSENSMNMMDNEMMQAMHQNMKESKLTGSLDCDFATMMINHHQSAIAMSKLEIEKGKDDKMISIAKNILKDQQTEISEMNTIMNNFKTTVVKDTSKIDKKMQEYMGSMMDEMMNMNLSGQIDKDFASLMIPHHESAIKMAKEELALGKQKELKALAQKMIKKQSSELEQFKSYLNN